MRPFLDTNILVYAFSSDARRERAWSLLTDGFEISVQNLNEFASVSRGKLQQDWQTVEDALATVIELSSVIHPLNLNLHVRGVALAERYKLRIYDALLLATALGAERGTFLSEDMHDGLVIEGTLTIRNPFTP